VVWDLWGYNLEYNSYSTTVERGFIEETLKVFDNLGVSPRTRVTFLCEEGNGVICAKHRDHVIISLVSLH